MPQIAGEIRGRKATRLRIVTMPRIAPGLVAPALARVLREDPELHCMLDVRSRRDMERWVSTRRYDVGIAILPVSHPAIGSQLLYEIRSEVLLPGDHPLAGRSAISGNDLAQERVIDLLPGLLLRRQTDDFFDSAGVALEYVMETASSLVACEMARQKAGVTIIDRISAMGINLEGMVLRPLDPPRWLPFGLIKPRGKPLPEPAERLVRSLCEYLQALTARDTDLRSSIRI